MHFQVALIAVSLAGQPRTLVLADFEEGVAPFPRKEGVEVSTEWAARGRSSLRISSVWAGARNFYSRWDQYDLFRMEVFNPSEEMVKLQITVRDDVTEGGYWARHNRFVTLAPGKNTVEFAVADMWRGQITGQRVHIPFHTDRITALILRPEGTVFVDHVRLEKSVETVKIKGLKAFDFGPDGSPVMPGFEPVTRKTLYSKERGYGWARDSFYRDADRIHPDNLFRDWISPAGNSFLVDLPAGEHVVHVQLEDPGYWEYYHWFNSRTVKAEGNVVLDETMGGDKFLGRYFRFQDVEDTPWDDTWQKYVERRHRWLSFRVKVEDGQLDLRFDSPETYGNTLSALLIWPASSDADGKRYLEHLAQKRLSQWSQRWKKPEHKRPSSRRRFSRGADRLGYVVFSRGCASDINWDTRPDPEELVRELTLEAARGEDEPAAFAIYPLRPLGKVHVTVSGLRGPGGAQIPSSAVDVRVGRYKNKRRFGHQSGMYDVDLRLLSHFNSRAGNELVMDDMFTRLFWITVSVPEDSPAGEYVGGLEITPEAAGRTGLAMRLKVRPFKLPEPDYHFSLYSIKTQPIPYYEETKVRDHKVRLMVYKDLKRHGVTYLGGLRVRAKLEGGKLQVSNVDEIEREIELRKSLGFKQGTIGFPKGASAGELASGKPIRGIPRDEFIRAWHLGLTDLALERSWPHPYFCFGDEPVLPRNLNELAAAHQALHAVSPDIWTGIAYHVDSKVAESFKMRDTLDVHHLKSFCSDEEFRAASKVGKFVLCSNPGSTRYAYGLRQWKLKTLGVDGCITFAYTGNHVDIYYALDGREDDCGMTFPTREGDLQHAPKYERLREGVDDFRYLQFAWELSERGGTGSAEARRYIEEMTSRVPSGRHSRTLVPWKELDEMRARLSELIGKMLGE